MVFLLDLKPDSQNILSAANVILDFSYKDLSRFPHILHSLFRPKIPITASDRNAAFQDPVINPLMLQIRRVLQFVQFEICTDDHRLFAAVTTINHIKCLFQCEIRLPLNSKIINDQQSIMIEPVDVCISVLPKHPGERIQNLRKIRRKDPMRRSSNALAMHPAINDLPLPTGPQIKRPLPFSHISSHRSTYV